jgi:sialic acid synthase SpsE
MNNLYFIAELGQNHQGDIKIAKEMVDSLVGTGVHAIKTAKREIDICLTEDQKNEIYDNPHSFGRTYYEHRQALELSHEDFWKLKIYAEKKGFDFISSFTDAPSFDYLKYIGVGQIKIASQRITDLKLLQHTALNFRGTVYMSSGMSKYDDIRRMIDIFKSNPKYLMQCTSVYPCPDNLINLRTLKDFRKYYKKKVNGFGFSGHNQSIIPDIVAYTLGAWTIERHYTLNRKWKGTDHAGSIELYRLRKLIKYLKQADACLGDRKKTILKEELPAIKKLRGDIENSKRNT